MTKIICSERTYLNGTEVEIVTFLTRFGSIEYFIVHPETRETLAQANTREEALLQIERRS